MALPLQEFAQRVIRGRLMTEGELAEYLDTFPPEKRPADGDALARVLVQDRKLTSFQCARILEGKESQLALGEFLLLSEIGKGGMGRVFKAVHRPSGAVAAIKVLTEEETRPGPGREIAPEASEVHGDRRSVALGRFRQEVMAASRLCHPNIVAAYEAGEENRVQYLVMEYVDGQDLATLVQEHGPVPVDVAMGWILQAARGLEYAHSKNVIHRDIKPGNLLVDQEGTIKILDMGLARVMEEEIVGPGATLAERLTMKGEMLGTVDYISPEQAVDTRSADRRSDIYSLGCTFYRLVTAEPLYEGETALGKLLAHYEAPIPSLRDALPDASPMLDQVFRKMVAKQPGERYQTMTEVIAALRACPEAATAGGRVWQPGAERAGQEGAARAHAGGSRASSSRTVSGVAEGTSWIRRSATPAEKTISSEQGTAKMGDSATSSNDKP
jgi:serine/threonine protein kinase